MLKVWYWPNGQTFESRLSNNMFYGQATLLNIASEAFFLLSKEKCFEALS